MQRKKTRKKTQTKNKNYKKKEQNCHVALWPLLYAWGSDVRNDKRTSGSLLRFRLAVQPVIIVMHQLGALHGEHVIDSGNVKGNLQGS